jgi:hypothetical protein
MKQCSKCREIKSLNDFYIRRDGGSSDGFEGTCIKCRLMHGDNWYANNRERVAKTGKQWRTANKARKAATNKAWQNANRDKMKGYYKRWGQKHKEKVAAKAARRRALKSSVTCGDLLKIGKIYKRAQELRQYFNVVVDHIIPLSKGGPHSPENLQIIYWHENALKHDSLDYQPKVIFI